MVFRKASKQRKRSRVPLTSKIMKRTKLHIKQQRNKQNRTQLPPKQGPTIACMQTWIPQKDRRKY